MSLSTMIGALFSTYAVATLFMTGVLWMVQFVQYPMLGRLPPEEFVPFEREYQRRMGAVVGLPMLAELIALPLLSWLAGASLGWPWVLASLLLLGVTHGSTFAWFIPAHTRLAQQFDSNLAARLVHYNWLRTIAWSLRAALVVQIAAQWCLASSG